MLQTIEYLNDAVSLDSRIGSELDLVALVETGLPAGAADALAELGLLSDAELGEIIPLRTLQHARKKGTLSAEQSDRVVRAIGILQRAHEVFGDSMKANRWLRRPSRPLGGKTPLSLLRTSSGSELVASLLDRIAYGVYS